MAEIGILTGWDGALSGWAARAPAAKRYRVTLCRSWQEAAPRWQSALEAGAAATPFQSRGWLDAFFSAAKNDPSVEPLIAFVEDGRAGLALALPLIRKMEGGVRRIAFADLEMTDFNAPLIGAAAQGFDAAALLSALRRALPPADLLDLKKMPLDIDGRPNPFARLAGAHASAVNGNLIAMGEDFEVWRASLPRQARKEMDRHWRVFTKHDGAAFRVVTDPAEALAILPALEAMQRKRLAEVGEPYRLAGPVTVALHRELMTRGIAEGFAVLTLLVAGEEVVAAAVGIRRGDTMVMIRLCQAGGEWSNASPGRLILARTLRHMHGEGCRNFDLSIGNFAYKRRFQVVRRPLADLALAMSWRGLPHVARAKAGAYLRQHPQLRRLVRQALGKRALREEG